MPPVKLVFRSARAVVIASCLSFQMYLMRVKERGIQGEILRKRPKNNKKKAWVKLSEAILSILGDC